MAPTLSQPSIRRAIESYRWVKTALYMSFRSAYGRVSQVDLETGEEQLLHAEHEDWIRTLRVSPDGRYVVSASQNCIGRVYDRQLGRLVFQEALAGRVLPAAEVSAEGQIVFVGFDGKPFAPA